MSGGETHSNRRRLEPGERVGDHLVVRSVLGQGGTAIVYEALHTRLGASVALKVLDVPDAFRYDGVLRMQREAEVCASIEDPHVPRIYDINALPDGTPYVVMEKVSGTTLEEMLASGPLALETVLDVTDDLLAALEAVHRVGVIHRDIKPANLILQREGDGTFRVRLMDFGVSKTVCAQASDPKLTRVGTVVGTPHYMAPEQITGEAVDARADVYATGVVLFEMLSGRMPFEGESTAEVVAAVLRQAPLPLASLRPDVPRPLESIVMRAMASRPNARYLTVRDMRAELAEFRTGQPVGRPSVLSLVPAPRGFTGPEREPEPTSGFTSFHSQHPSSHEATRSAATRRYSILGAGLAVLVGTVGFPRAAKHVSTAETVPAQEAAAQIAEEAPHAQAANQAPLAPLPAARDDGSVLEAPRYQLRLPEQHLEIATTPAPLPEAEDIPREEAAEVQEPEHTLQVEVHDQAAAAEQRAMRAEERAARRRLRETEAKMGREEAPDPGVLISDYVKQIEAIQQDAIDTNDTLPETSPEVPHLGTDLPPNPYPN